MQQNHKTIFTFSELAKYLGITRQAVSSYKKNNPKRFKLILLGYACKRLDIDYDDLKELNKLKGYIVTDNKRNGYRYFFKQQELAEYLNVTIDTIRAFSKIKSSNVLKRNELILLGFAIQKIKADLNDLIKLNDYKKKKDELNNYTF